MAHGLFRRAGGPRRPMPAAIMLGASTFTMSAMPGTPAIQNAIPMPFFGTTPFAAAGLGLIASAIGLGFGPRWLRRREAAARRAGEGYGPDPDSGSPADAAADDSVVRERATVVQEVVQEFDPAETRRGRHGAAPLPVWSAAVPIATVVAVNPAMSALVPPGLDADFLAAERWGGVSLGEVGGVWSVSVALARAIGVLVPLHRRRLPDPRASADAGANAAALLVLSVAGLVGFGAVVAALPAFAAVRDWVLDLGGGPLVSLAVATDLLAALTGSASGGLTITPKAWRPTSRHLAQEQGTDPALLHRVAVIGAGTLDALPHNGAVVTLLAVCGCTHPRATSTRWWRGSWGR